jgi:hypothetical protein
MECGALHRFLSFVLSSWEKKERKRCRAPHSIEKPPGECHVARQPHPSHQGYDPPTAHLRKEPELVGEEASTMIELTEQQRQAVRNGEAIRLAAPEIGEDVILLSAAHYECLRELLEDQREQRAILRYSMKQAAQVTNENPD